MINFRSYTVVAVAIVVAYLSLGFSQAKATTGVCPSTTSLFGTVKAVHGATILEKSTGPHGFENISIAGATVHFDNLKLKPGIFVGAFGCFTADFSRFTASEITLASDAATYPKNRHTETLIGIVRDVDRGNLLVDTGRPHGYVTILRPQSGAGKVGTRVEAVGSFNPDGTFLASQINAFPTSQPPSRVGVCPSSTSIFGTVHEVREKTLLVKTLGPHGFENISIMGATIHYDGLMLRPGVFIGAFGCFTVDYGRFSATELTLASDAATYPTNRHTELLTGVVREIDKSNLLVDTGMPHGYVTILNLVSPNAKVGEQLRATGSFNPNGTFSATRIQLMP